MIKNSEVPQTLGVSLTPYSGCLNELCDITAQREGMSVGWKQLFLSGAKVRGPYFRRWCPGKAADSFRLFSLMQVSQAFAPPDLCLVRMRRCQSTTTGDCGYVTLPDST